MVLKRLFPGRHNGPIKRALPEPADRLLDENPGIHKKVAAKHESLPNFACAQEESPLLQDNSAGLVSQMVAVLGSKGGVGATTFAMNLACAMSQKGHRTTLVDANFQQPDIATSLAIEPRHTLVDLLVRADEIDRKLFDACGIDLAEAGVPITVISPPLDGTAGVRLNLTQLSDCLHQVMPYSRQWIIDVPKHLDKHLVTLLDGCDQIVVVMEPTIPGVAACRRWLNTLSQLGYNSEKITCVLNRVGSQFLSVEKEAIACFREQQVFKLPNAFGISWECVTKGKPAVCLHPKHAYSRAVRAVADHLLAKAQPSADSSNSEKRVEREEIA